MLDNFPHIKAYWVMLGIKTAQVALSFGADDLDGTVVHEKIYHDAGSDSPQELTVAEIRRLIEEAGRVPVERDTLYHEVIRKEDRWQTGRVAAPAQQLRTLRRFCFRLVSRRRNARQDAPTTQTPPERISKKELVLCRE